MRPSLACFLVAGAVVLLQLFPLTGIVLAMLGGPFWSALLINLGFILLAAEALTEDAPRFLLIAPALWFGGYGIATIDSHLQAYSFYRGIVANNAPKLVGWDQRSMDLIITRGPDDSFIGSNLTPDALVNDYSIDRVYENRGTAPQGGMWLTELVQENCPRKGVGVEDGVVFETPYNRKRHPDQRTGPAAGLCLKTRQSSSWLPSIDIEPGRIEERRQGLIETSRQPITISRSGSTIATVETGWARPLSWLPLPMIGCGLNDGQAKWECFAAFSREGISRKTGDTSSPVAVVAHALGLKRASIAERFPANWPPDA
ncbi:hypothetical protein DMC47_35870 [Nostoc sp. 3335mG]|nr:hypothetical protein DMC47_35870 [Nostoc sp. 3335mG]